MQPPLLVTPEQAWFLFSKGEISRCFAFVQACTPAGWATVVNASGVPALFLPGNERQRALVAEEHARRRLEAFGRQASRHVASQQMRNKLKAQEDQLKAIAAKYQLEIQRSKKRKGV